jgi:hypothetical protein
MHREIFAGKSCPGNKVDLELLIRKANAFSPAAPTSPVSPAGISLVIRHNVNVRSGAASVTADIKTVLKAGTHVVAANAVTGDSVNGNNKWYQLAVGEFIWAGATDQP